jgi:hypothetical protein
VPASTAGPLGIRTIHIGPTGPLGSIGQMGPVGPMAHISQTGISQATFRRATVFDDWYVAIAVDTSPASPTTATSPKVWVFEPSSPHNVDRNSAL